MSLTKPAAQELYTALSAFEISDRPRSPNEVLMTEIAKILVRKVQEAEAGTNIFPKAINGAQITAIAQELLRKAVAANISSQQEIPSDYSTEQLTDWVNQELTGVLAQSAKPLYLSRAINDGASASSSKTQIGSR